MSKETVKSIIDALSGDAIRQRLGVSEFSIKHARAAGTFTASWYAQISEMCTEAGIECPMDLFNWKTSDAPQGVES